MITSGRYKTIPFDEIMASAKMMLGIEQTNDNDGFLKILINEGLMHLDNLDKYGVFASQFEIKDNRVCLPNGLSQVLGFSFTDKDGCYLDAYASNENGDGRPEILKGPVGSQLFSQYNVVTNNGGMIVFDYCDLPSNYIRLMWKGRNVDSFGLTVAREEEERGVRAYACWKFSERFPERYGRDLRSGWQREWKLQKRYLRADAVQNSYYQNREKIQALWGAYVVFKNFGVS